MKPVHAVDRLLDVQDLPMHTVFYSRTADLACVINTNNTTNCVCVCDFGGWGWVLVGVQKASIYKLYR